MAIIRRGPSGWCQVGRWEPELGTFQPGAWLHGTIYPQRCDLSPDGRWLVYFTLKAGARWDVGATYLAVSRLPWLTALAAWGTCGTWTRGLHFVEERRTWEAGDPEVGDVRPLRRRFGLAGTRAATFAVERRRGWLESADTPARTTDDAWDERRADRVTMEKVRPAGPRYASDGDRALRRLPRHGARLGPTAVRHDRRRRCPAARWRAMGRLGPDRAAARGHGRWCARYPRGTVRPAIRDLDYDLADAPARPDRATGRGSSLVAMMLGCARGRSYDDDVRTTVTLEPDVDAMVRRIMRERGLGFKQAVNESHPRWYRSRPPGVDRIGADLDKALRARRGARGRSRSFASRCSGPTSARMGGLLLIPAAGTPITSTLVRELIDADRHGR